MHLLSCILSPDCCRLGKPDAPRSLWIYTTPTGANSTRLIINSAHNTAAAPSFSQKGLAGLRAKLLGFMLKSR